MVAAAFKGVQLKANSAQEAIDKREKLERELKTKNLELADMIRERDRALHEKDRTTGGHKDEMEKHAGSFDFILDTVAAQHPVADYVNLLKLDGTLVLVGAPPDSFELDAFTTGSPETCPRGGAS